MLVLCTVTIPHCNVNGCKLAVPVPRSLLRLLRCRPRGTSPLSVLLLKCRGSAGRSRAICKFDRMGRHFGKRRGIFPYNMRDITHSRKGEEHSMVKSVERKICKCEVQSVSLSDTAYGNNRERFLSIDYKVFDEMVGLYIQHCWTVQTKKHR